MSQSAAGAGNSGTSWWCGTLRPNIYHASGEVETIVTAAKHVADQIGTFVPLHVYVDGQHYATIDNGVFSFHEPPARDRMSQ